MCCELVCMQGWVYSLACRGLAAAERHCSVGTMLPEVCCSTDRQHSANPAQGQMAVQAVDLLF